MKYLCWIMLATGLASSAIDARAQDVRRGADTYKLCASCHGFKGQGNQLVNAPGLAGQENWYLSRQIKNFRDGIRGSSDDDAHGQTMATMTLGIDSDEDVDDLVSYIGTLPTPAPETTVDGDVDSGRTLYAPCAACHGQNGEGNRALNAPALATMADWYQIAQLAKFKSGHRGGASRDIYGMQMAPMAATLVDEKAMRDVVAYINALQ